MPKPSKSSRPGYRKPEECYDPKRVSDRHRVLMLPSMEARYPEYEGSFMVTATIGVESPFPIRDEVPITIDWRDILATVE
jgi:hypothetical protein